MKSGVSPDQSIAGVLDSLSQSRALLLDPSAGNIDHCRMMMGQCAERLAELVQEREFAARAGDRFFADVRLVRSELASLAGLLNAAAVLRRDMLQAMRDAAGNVSRDVPAATPSEPKARRVHMLC